MSEGLDKERIYTDYYEKVTHYIHGKVSNRLDAEDLTSQVFLKVYAGLSGFDEKKAALSTWIYAITRNEVIDFYRRAKTFEQLPEALSGGEDAFEALFTDEMLNILADALKALDERSRDLILLHYYSGYTLKATAEAMGISYVYAKVLHKNALEAMRKYF